MWEDAVCAEIRKGDKVWYCGDENDDTVYGPAMAMMIGPMGWVCDRGEGQTVVGNEGHNYLGHSQGKDRQPDHLGHFLNSHGAD